MRSVHPIARASLDRRAMLSLVAATTALAGCSGAGPGTETRHVRLDATASGWKGIEPTAIAGETNPTLAFESGTTYALGWENRDGEKHRLVITDESGTTLESTGSTENEGAKQTVAFAADPEMTAYHDVYHPEALGGGIRIADG